MDERIQIPVNIPLDDRGMLGRECLTCERYFKLKPGTGLRTDYCHCPYCEYEGNMDTFWTPAQLEYMQSVALNYAFTNIVKPSLDKLTKSFKDLERETRHNSFFKVTVKGLPMHFSVPIQYYSEKDLETNMTCDSCGLVFSVYGVFARCPDCKDFNAFAIFEKSIGITKKQFDILTQEGVPAEVKANSLGFVLAGCVSAFDGLGKELRRRRADVYPPKPKNIFQNLFLLNESLSGVFENSHSNFQFMLKMFQVRHLYEHNMGVIDEDFAMKIPGHQANIGRKYVLDRNEISAFIDGMFELGIIAKAHFKGPATKQISNL